MMLVARGLEAVLALGRIDNGACQVEDTVQVRDTRGRAVHTFADGDPSDSVGPPLAGDAATYLAEQPSPAAGRRCVAGRCTTPALPHRGEYQAVRPGGKADGVGIGHVRCSAQSRGLQLRWEPHQALRRWWHGRPEPLAASTHERRAPRVSTDVAEPASDHRGTDADQSSRDDQGRAGGFCCR